MPKRWRLEDFGTPLTLPDTPPAREQRPEWRVEDAEGERLGVLIADQINAARAAHTGPRTLPAAAAALPLLYEAERYYRADDFGKAVFCMMEAAFEPRFSIAESRALEIAEFFETTAARYGYDSAMAETMEKFKVSKATAERARDARDALIRAPHLRADLSE